MTIKLGAHNRHAKEGSQLVMESSQFKVHEEWKAEEVGSNDIGLVFLDKAITFNGEH